MWVPFVIITFATLHACTCKDIQDNYYGSTAPPGDPRHCIRPTDKPVLRFETLPGGGWDNLMNKEMGRVLNINYTQCKITDDGKYLVSDGVMIIPVKSSEVEIFAELFDHWKSFTSTLSRSINIDVGVNLLVAKISGHFSYEHESVKKHQYMDKTSTIRIQARYIRYTAQSQPDTPLHPAFRARLERIAAHVQLNRTTMARYESQLLVRDFGTQIIRSVEVGAALVQLDQVHSTFVRQYSSEKTSILASASASFFGIFKFDASYKQAATQTMTDQYYKSRTHSKIHTFGGPVFTPNNYSANTWSEGLDDNLVAMDRSGDPIYYVITPEVLPNIPEPTVFEIYSHVEKAVKLYYEHNTYRGCTDMDSPNFNFQANVDDNSCQQSFTNYTFGGVYQTCLEPGRNCWSKWSQKNPITGDYSCPPGYKSVFLSDFLEPVCYTCWRWLWYRYTCCDSIRNRAYWCAAEGEVRQQSGFLFGGVFTENTINPLTQAKSCPSKFYPLRLLTDLTICVSDDYELGYRFSIPFAGFYSCKSGNPLVINERGPKGHQTSNGMLTLASFMRQSGETTWPRECPEGYSQHLALVYNDCEINYCAKTRTLSSLGLPKIQRPPYMPSPHELTRDGQIILSHDGNTWQAMNGSMWTLNTTEASEDTNLQKSNGDNGFSNREMNSVTIVIVSVSATMCCVLVATVILIRCKKFRSKERTGLYRQISDETMPLFVNRAIITSVETKC
ncbi:hypothetical protein CHS0354_032881 [Potamilus streckersoni]|uniref:MACPF domain-containing protein n=1 Tax=Potamilus streckersoni TaxID=2493646 RepID=A0AAE0SM49_9BIVA|nr:hypothetical protein CHS0354_032881 [Potamilus streckersoni]